MQNLVFVCPAGAVCTENWFIDDGGSCAGRPIGGRNKDKAGKNRPNCTAYQYIYHNGIGYSCQIYGCQSYGNASVECTSCVSGFVQYAYPLGHWQCACDTSVSCHSSCSTGKCFYSIGFGGNAEYSCTACPLGKYIRTATRDGVGSFCSTPAECQSDARIRAVDTESKRCSASDHICPVGTALDTNTKICSCNGYVLEEACLDSCPTGGICTDGAATCPAGTDHDETANACGPLGATCFGANAACRF